MCTPCKVLDQILRNEEKTSATLSPEEKIMCTFPSSNYPLSLLSPASQRVRLRK